MVYAKSQANLISVVVLILVILVTVVILWNVVYSTTKKTSEDIGIDIFSNSIELTESKIGFIGDVKIKIKRISGKEEIDSIKFIFYDEDGKIHLVERKKENYELPKELETKSFKFSADEINSNGKKIVKIDAVPVFGEKIGIGDSEDKLGTISLSDENDKKYLKELGLISLWKFEDNYQDSVGVNHGTANGAPIFVDGVQGKAVKLDGNDDWVNVSNSASLNGMSELTLSAWINLDNLKNADILAKFSAYNLWTAYNNGRIVFRITNSSGDHQLGVVSPIGSKLSTNQWYHIVGTYNGTIGILYINGLPVAVNSWRGKINTNPNHLWIGRQAILRYFNGSIDELQIFNSSLTETEVFFLYNNGND